jgi:hypothetical protein
MLFKGSYRYFLLDAAENEINNAVLRIFTLLFENNRKVRWEFVSTKCVILARIMSNFKGIFRWKKVTDFYIITGDNSLTYVL